MNKEVKKMLLVEKKELLKQKKKQEGIKVKKEDVNNLEKDIWEDFINKYKDGAFLGNHIVSAWSKDKLDGNCTLSSDTKNKSYYMTNSLHEAITKRLKKNGIKQIWYDYAVEFLISKNRFEKIMDSVYGSKKKSKSKKLSRDYHNIDTKTKDEEKDK